MVPPRRFLDRVGVGDVLVCLRQRLRDRLGAAQAALLRIPHHRNDERDQTKQLWQRGEDRGECSHRLRALAFPKHPPKHGTNGQDAADQCDGHFLRQVALADQDAARRVEANSENLLNCIPVH